MSARPRRWTAWLIPALAVAADRVAKELAVGLPAQGVTLIPGVLGLRWAENRGIAFSLFSGRPVLLGVLSLALLLLAGRLLRGRVRGALPRAGLLLMLGGALGNLPDRLFRGYVPDMIETLFIPFPIFNVADACLTVGCALVLFSLLFRPRDWAL